MNPVVTFPWKYTKTYTLTFDIFWPCLGPKQAQKFVPHGPFFTQTWKYSQFSCRPSSWSHIDKYFLRKWQKPRKFLFFTYFFLITDPLKIVSRYQNSTSTTFWPILCTFRLTIGKIKWKLRELVGFEKELTIHGQTDGWMDNGQLGIG